MFNDEGTGTCMQRDGRRACPRWFLYSLGAFAERRMTRKRAKE
jgi:hypothetical protein